MSSTPDDDDIYIDDIETYLSGALSYEELREMFLSELCNQCVFIKVILEFGEEDTALELLKDTKPYPSPDVIDQAIYYSVTRLDSKQLILSHYVSTRRSYEPNILIPEEIKRRGYEHKDDEEGSDDDESGDEGVSKSGRGLDWFHYTIEAARSLNEHAFRIVYPVLGGEREDIGEELMYDEVEIQEFASRLCAELSLSTPQG